MRIVHIRVRLYTASNPCNDDNDVNDDNYDYCDKDDIDDKNDKVTIVDDNEAFFKKFWQKISNEDD